MAHQSRTIARNLCACLLVSVLLIGLSGCSWQRIPAPPMFGQQMKIPGRFGIIVSSNPASMTYGPKIVDQLKRWGAFDSLEYPYREGDEVDAVLNLTVEGGWHAQTGANLARGFLIGLTFFALSPVLGVEMIGNHSLAASVSEDGVEQFICGFDKRARIEWGLGANTNEVALKADRLQVGQLADGLVACVRDRWKPEKNPSKP